MSLTFTPEMLASLNPKLQKAVSAAAAALSGQDSKPKKTLTPEHLAKLKAGREAAAAKKAAEKAAVEGASDAETVAEEPSGASAPVAEAKPKKVLSPEHLAKLKAGREAAAAKKAAEKAAEKDAAPLEGEVIVAA